MPVIFFTVSGEAATRFSKGHRSFGIPIFMETSWVRGAKQQEVGHTDDHQAANTHAKGQGNWCDE